MKFKNSARKYGRLVRSRAKLKSNFAFTTCTSSSRARNKNKIDGGRSNYIKICLQTHLPISYSCRNENLRYLLSKWLRNAIQTVMYDFSFGPKEFAFVVLETKITNNKIQNGGSVCKKTFIFHEIIFNFVFCGAMKCCRSYRYCEQKFQCKIFCMLIECN